MKVYKIKDWPDFFENNKSKERKKCSFCCIPNKQDGLGYGTLLREPDGAALYGAFIAVLLIASKQQDREGWLTSSGLPADCPLNARQMSIKSQMPENVIQMMLDTVTRSDIGWIEIYNQGDLENCIEANETKGFHESARRVPAECPPSALETKGTEGNRNEEKENSAGKPAGVSLGKASEIQVSKKPEAANTPVPTIHLPKGFEEFWKAYPNKKGKQAAARSYGYAIKKTTIEIMLAAIEKQKRGADWLKDGGQYIPHPTTWLNQGRWDDEVTPRHFKNVDSNLMQEKIEVRSL